MEVSGILWELVGKISIIKERRKGWVRAFRKLIRVCLRNLLHFPLPQQIEPNKQFQNYFFLLLLSFSPQPNTMFSFAIE
jgi:hypothetical protein